jgi:hypothetical protein
LPVKPWYRPPIRRYLSSQLASHSKNVAVWARTLELLTGTGQELLSGSSTMV